MDSTDHLGTQAADVMAAWGWAGNVFIVAGILFVAYKWRYGFLCGTTGNTLWGIKGFLTGQDDLVAISALIVVLQAFSFWKWGRANVGSTRDIHSGTTPAE